VTIIRAFYGDCAFRSLLATIPASHMGVHGRSHRVFGPVIAVLAASGAALPARRLRRAVPANAWRVEVSGH